MMLERTDFIGKKTGKRAQMELLGLAIIIILVSIGFLFVVRFVLLKPADDVKKEYSFNQMASNELNAILKTTTADCKGTDMTELLQDCSSFEKIVCEDGRGSCQYAAETIDFILNQTLSSWQKTYVFNVSVNEDTIIYISDGEVRPDKERQVKLFPIPIDVGTMIVKLMIYG